MLAPVGAAAREHEVDVELKEFITQSLMQIPKASRTHKNA
jgi:hypothetical protein